MEKALHKLQIEHRLGRKVTPGYWSWIAGLPLLLTVACSGDHPTQESPAKGLTSQLPLKATVIDTAVTTRFFRFEGETKKPFDPKALFESGISAVVLGAGTLSEEVDIGDVTLPLFEGPQPGHPTFRSVFEGPAVIRRVLQELDALHQAIDGNEGVEIALNESDLDRINREGKLAVIAGLDAGVEIDEDLAVLRMYARLGVRKLSLVHETPASWADSCTGILDDGDLGLSDFGREVVRECNRLGMVLDISHTSDETARETIEASNRPVLASHSGARALSNVSRNIPDAILETLAKRGGVVGVGGFLDRSVTEKFAATGYYQRRLQIVRHLLPRYPDPFQLAFTLRSQQRLEEIRRELGLPLDEIPQSDLPFPTGSGATITSTLDHIDYLVKLIGVDHVAIGVDGDMRAPGYTQLFRELTQGLEERKYSSEDIRKILGANFLRLFRDNAS